jgi:hypothetical protein
MTLHWAVCALTGCVQYGDRMRSVAAFGPHEAAACLFQTRGAIGAQRLSLTRADTLIG